MKRIVAVMSLPLLLSACSGSSTPVEKLYRALDEGDMKAAMEQIHPTQRTGMQGAGTAFALEVMSQVMAECGGLKSIKTEDQSDGKVVRVKADFEFNNPEQKKRCGPQSDLMTLRDSDEGPKLFLLSSDRDERRKAYERNKAESYRQIDNLINQTKQ